MNKSRETRESTSADRPKAGVFSVVREKWMAGAMLGAGVVAAGLWALQPDHGSGAISASLRDIPEFQADAAEIGEGAIRPDVPAEVGQAVAGETPEAARRQLARVPSATVDQLESRFERYNYSLQTVRAANAEVPRIVPLTVPADLQEVKQVDRKKQVFLQMVLPLVLMVNERLVEQRERLQELAIKLDAGKGLAPSQRVWLEEMYETYRLDAEEAGIEDLLRRVDVVPPSLALAQAAIESGWGTSRFAREGNALFGQWVWGDDADGIVPEDRESGKTHKIRAFETPLEAVAAYIKNLNTHRAYRKLRDMRRDLRDQGAGINGLTLAGGLEAYSEKGMKYVKLVRNIIAANELRPLDKARLAGAPRRPSNV